jgi:hypothetical protein
MPSQAVRFSKPIHVFRLAFARAMGAARSGKPDDAQPDIAKLAATSAGRQTTSKSNMTLFESEYLGVMLLCAALTLCVWWVLTTYR